MNHLDLFSGYGGFTIAAQKFGIKTINFSEIDKYANAVLKYRFPNIPNLGDVTQIKKTDISEPVDIITGGSPCQDLSVAGKGAGLNGKRSGLFFHFIRIIAEIQPTYFVWENVKGAFSSNRGWDFARVQIEMEQAGYDVWWQLLNAKDFGVPQNRERIFAIGIRKGGGREILFEQRNSSKNLEELTRNVSQGYRIYNTCGIATAQASQAGGVGAKTGLYAIDSVDRKSRKYTVSKKNISPTLTSSMFKGVDAIGRSMVIDLSTNNPQMTNHVRAIQARYNKGYSKRNGETSGVLDNTRIRRLTPVECERLMGLEDEWTSKGIIDGKEVSISDTQRYMLCGNGVVIPCVEYIYGIINQIL